MSSQSPSLSQQSNAEAVTWRSLAATCLSTDRERRATLLTEHQECIPHSVPKELELRFERSGGLALPPPQFPGSSAGFSSARRSHKVPPWPGLCPLHSPTAHPVGTFKAKLEPALPMGGDVSPGTSKAKEVLDPGSSGACPVCCHNAWKEGTGRCGHAGLT